MDEPLKIKEQTQNTQHVQQNNPIPENLVPLQDQKNLNLQLDAQKEQQHQFPVQTGNKKIQTKEESFTGQSAVQSLRGQIDALDGTWGFFGSSREMKLVKSQYRKLKAFMDRSCKGLNMRTLKYQLSYELMEMIRVCEDYKKAKIKDPAHDTSKRHRLVMNIRESANRSLSFISGITDQQYLEWKKNAAAPQITVTDFMRSQTSKVPELTAEQKKDVKEQTLRYAHNTRAMEALIHLSQNSETAGPICQTASNYQTLLEEQIPQDNTYGEKLRVLQQKCLELIGCCEEYSNRVKPRFEASRKRLTYVRELLALYKNEYLELQALEKKEPGQRSLGAGSFQRAVLSGTVRVAPVKTTVPGEKNEKTVLTADDGRTGLIFTKPEESKMNRRVSLLGNILGAPQQNYLQYEEALMQDEAGNLTDGFIYERKGKNGLMYLTMEGIMNIVINHDTGRRMNILYSDQAKKDLANIQVMDVILGIYDRPQNSLRYQAKNELLNGEQTVVIQSVLALSNPGAYSTLSPKQLNEAKPKEVRLSTKEKAVGEERSIVDLQEQHFHSKLEGKEGILLQTSPTLLEGIQKVNTDQLAEQLAATGNALTKDQQNALKDRMEYLKEKINEVNGKKQEKEQLSSYALKEFAGQMKALERDYAEQEYNRKHYNSSLHKSREEHRIYIGEIKNTLFEIREQKKKAGNSETLRLKKKETLKQKLKVDLEKKNLSKESRDILGKLEEYGEMNLVCRYCTETDEKTKKTTSFIPDEKLKKEGLLLVKAEELLKGRLAKLPKKEGKEEEKAEREMLLYYQSFIHDTISGKLPEPGPKDKQIEKTDKSFVYAKMKTIKVDGKADYVMEKKEYSWKDRRDEPLFAHEPTVEDVAQGHCGDCYALASIAAVAEHSPQLIREMMRDNGDGTVTVRLFATPKDPIYVRVEKSVPMRISGKTNKMSDLYAKGALWVQMLEKAFAASGLYTKLKIGDRDDNLDVSSELEVDNQVTYTTIEGGTAGQFLKVLTGTETKEMKVSVGYHLNKDPNQLEKKEPLVDVQTKAVLSILQDEEKRKNYIITASTKDLTTTDHFRGKNNEKMMHGIAGRHEYTVLGIHSFKDQQQRILLRNPWGHGGTEEVYNEVTGAISSRASEDVSDGGLLFVPLDLFYEVFDRFTITSINPTK